MAERDADTSRRLEIGLLVLRLTTGVFFLVWAVDKIVNIGHAQAVFSKYYLMALGSELSVILGIAQAIVVLAFIVGLWKVWTLWCAPRHAHGVRGGDMAQPSFAVRGGPRHSFLGRRAGIGRAAAAVAGARPGPLVEPVALMAACGRLAARTQAPRAARPRGWSAPPPQRR